MLVNSYARFSSNIAVPILLPAWNQCRTLWRRKLALGRVSMSSSTTFHSDSNRPIPRVSMFSLDIRNRIIHPVTSRSPHAATWNEWYPQASVTAPAWGGVDVPSAGYSSWSHFLKFSVRRSVCPPSLWSWICCTTDSILPSEGTSPLTLKVLMWVGTGLPGGGGGFFLLVQLVLIPCNPGHVRPRGVWCPCRRVLVPPF